MNKSHLSSLINILESTYWKIRYYISNKYFYFKYHNKPNDIYCDHLTHTYLHPKQLIERSPNLLYVLCEVIHDNLVYTYTINNIEHHTHSFDQLLLEAYRYKQSFLLLNPTELSEQELRLIEKAKSTTL